MYSKPSKMSVEKDGILIVIVLYKEKLRDSISFKSLNVCKIANKILVYDNSPVIDNEAVRNKAFFYVHDERNLGVSYAYNEAAQLALKLGKKWLLLLDQDTELPEGFMEDVENMSKAHPPVSLYAMKLYSNGQLISPSGYRYKKGYLLNYIEIGLNKLNNITFLNSGLLISTALFLKAGGYDKNVPLYFSDFVFINRLRRMIDSFVLLPIELIHNLSSNDETDIPSFKVRYNFYLDGAFQAMKSERNGYIAYYLTTFLRAVKLTVKLKDFYFMKFYLKKLIQ